MRLRELVHQYAARNRHAPLLKVSSIFVFQIVLVLDLPLTLLALCSPVLARCWRNAKKFLFTQPPPE